jgi:hypothetical protein
VTTQPPDPAPPSLPAGSPPPALDKDARPAIAPYRELAALALLGANAAFLAFAVISLFTVFVEDARVTSFSGRADGQFGTYVGLVSIFFPLAAVLIATLIRPAAPRGKMITMVALVEYGVSVVFGLVCLFAGFIQTVGADYSGAIIDAFLALLARLVWLILLGFGAFVVARVFQSLYFVPKPKPVPVPPGYPQGYNPAYQAAYGPSGAYSTVQGYPQGYAQPGYPQQGYPQPQPGYPQQGYPPGGYPQQGYPPAGYPSAGAPPPSTPFTAGPPAPTGSPAEPAPGAGPQGADPTTAFAQTGWAPPATPAPPAPPVTSAPPATPAPPFPPAPVSGPGAVPPASSPPPAPPGSPTAPSAGGPADEESDSTQLIPQPPRQSGGEPSSEEYRPQPSAGRRPDGDEEPTQPWS